MTTAAVGERRQVRNSRNKPVTVARPGLTLTAHNLLLSVGPLINIALVGRMPPDDLYLRSLFQPLSLVLIAVVTGLGVPTQVIAARLTGKGQRPGLGLFLRMQGIGLVAAAILAVACVLLLGGRQPGLMMFAVSMVFALPFAIAGELTSAALRGCGATTASTLLAAVYVLTNACLTGGLGVYAGLGLNALPLAMGTAGCLEALIGCWLLYSRGLLRPRIPVPPLLPALLRIGLPSAATSLLLFAVSLALVAIASRFGADVVSAIAIGSLVEGLAMAPALAYGVAMGNAMHGAVLRSDGPGARTVFRQGMTQIVAGYAAFTVLMIVAGGHLAALLTDQPGVRTALSSYLRIAGPAIGATGIVITALIVLQQLGLGAVTLAMNVAYFGLFLLIAATCAHNSPQTLYWVLSLGAASNIVTGLPLTCALILRMVRRMAAPARHRRPTRVDL